MKLLILLPVLFFNLAFGQDKIEITRAELEKFALNNVERIACEVDNKLNEIQIDSLTREVDVLNDQIELKTQNIEDYKLIVKDVRAINEVRVVQLAEYKAKSEADDATIKKQNGKLNFWRIFTPVVVTGVGVIAVIK